MSKLRENFKNVISKNNYSIPLVEQFEQITDDFAIKFADFLRTKTEQTQNGGYKLYSDFEIYGLTELLQIFKDKYYE